MPSPLHKLDSDRRAGFWDTQKRAPYSAPLLSAEIFSLCLYKRLFAQSFEAFVEKTPKIGPHLLDKLGP